MAPLPRRHVRRHGPIRRAAHPARHAALRARHPNPHHRPALGRAAGHALHRRRRLICRTYPPHTTRPFPPQFQFHSNPLPIANHPPFRPASPNAPALAPSTSGAPRTSSSTRSSCSPLRCTWSGWSRRSTTRIADVRPRGRWVCCLRRGYDGGSGGRDEDGESRRGGVSSGGRLRMRW